MAIRETQLHMQNKVIFISNAKRNGTKQVKQHTALALLKLSHLPDLSCLNQGSRLPFITSSSWAYSENSYSASSISHLRSGSLLFWTIVTTQKYPLQREGMQYSLCLCLGPRIEMTLTSKGFPLGKELPVPKTTPGFS